MTGGPGPAPAAAAAGSEGALCCRSCCWSAFRGVTLEKYEVIFSAGPLGKNALSVGPPRLAPRTPPAPAAGPEAAAAAVPGRLSMPTMVRECPSCWKRSGGSPVSTTPGTPGPAPMAPAPMAPAPMAPAPMAPALPGPAAAGSCEENKEEEEEAPAAPAVRCCCCCCCCSPSGWVRGAGGGRRHWTMCRVGACCPVK